MVTYAVLFFQLFTTGISQTLTDPQHNQYADVIALILDEKANMNQLKNELEQMKLQQQAVQLQYKNNTDSMLRTMQELLSEETALQQSTETMTRALSNLTQNSQLRKRSLSSMQQQLNTVIQANKINDGLMNSLNQTFSSLITNNRNMSKSVQGVQLDLTSMQNNVTQLREEIKNETDYKMIAFSGKRGITGTVTSRQPIIFSSNTRYVGTGYNATDGIFYCKQAGWYMFDVTLTSNAASFVYLTKNNADVMAIWSGEEYNNAYSPSSSRAITLPLDVGDKVWVRSNGNTYNAESYLSITFISKK